MIFIKIDWTLVAICFSGAVTLYIIKFLVALYRRSRLQSNPNGDSISEKLDNYQEPPPEFNNALKYSQPVSYVEIEEPPPSYIDYLQLTQSQSQLGLSIVSTNEVRKENSEVNNFTVKY